MACIDGFVIPVATANKQAFLDHAHAVDKFFIDYGPVRVVECWPDKATRDTGRAQIMADPDIISNAPPFDGKRMIYGGFVPVYSVEA